MFRYVVRSVNEFDSAAEVLQAVASPLRLAILVRLNETPRAVGELATMLSRDQPLVSHHLTILRWAGLVSVRRQGRQSVYSATGHPVVEFAVATVNHYVN